MLNTISRTTKTVGKDPDKQEEKNIIYNKVIGNHQVWENTGLTKDTNANPKIQGEYKFNLSGLMKSSEVSSKEL